MLALSLASQGQAFLSEGHRPPDRGWILSQNILNEIKSFPQGKVKVKSTFNECAYNILNFGFMFHIDYIARTIPAHGVTMMKR
jgi:hypothetical protein